ncbi:Fermitin family 1 [Schistosoma japonicum]|uniref:Fermitin family 1 n=2 Tax=Schistosoma japonicum TaxID=6182 RepID=A0A4Z2DDE8_SCHJA|nr:Fermitin family 1 [Schistosoma japonicum]TNN14543.1 Fermitin family 1 [Schistosoma japonicum]TNN14544.1 Fermitin family 1 [Schistosoma japonicum]
MSAYDPFSAHNGSTHAFNGAETISRMVVDGNYIDGSWELSVFVEDINTNVSVRVLGDLPLGGLMHRIVEKVKLQQSWSDHAIWWVDRNMWLLHNRTTLDQYGIQSDAKLMFRRMHNDVQIVLPSLTSLVLRVNYAARLFTVVRDICKELNIRHSEELSLALPITKNMLKTNCPLPTVRPGLRRPCTSLPNSRSDQPPVKSKVPSPSSVYPAADGQQMNPYNTLNSNAGTMMRFKSDNSLDQERLDSARYADCSLRRSAKAVFADNWLMKPKNLIQKARLNSGWLDSARSLLEQGIKPPNLESDNHDASNPPTLYLCFKYFTFYDLILKYDAVRIHQLYEQARWSLLSGQFDCTEDEMVVFAAYQLQAELQSAVVNQQLCINNYPDMNSTNPYPTLGACSTASSNYVNRSPVHITSSPDLIRKHYPHYASSGLVSQYPRTSLSPGGSAFMDETPSNVHNIGGVDEVDELLSELEQSCGVTEESESVSRTLQSVIRPTSHDVMDTSEVPKLEGVIKVFRDRSRLLKRYKAYWAVIVEAHLYLFRNKTQTNECLAEYSLRDCTVSPDVSVAHQKYVIKLSVVSVMDQKISNGSVTVPAQPSTPKELSIREELLLKFDSAEQYACWLAACRLGSRGKTLASKVAYSKEVEATLELIKLQMPGPSPAMSLSESTAYLGDLTDFCNDRIIRKARSKDALRQRITEAHVNIRDLGLLEAKYKYIQTWQRLTGFGRSYFIVQFERGLPGFPSTNGGGLFSTPMDDMIAICQGRIEVVSAQTGEVLLTWNFSDLRSWNVNWDAEKVILEFRSSQVSFRPLSTNCKTVVEFIGGYVFLSQRNLEKSQEVNERLFHRLTGASD